MTPSVTPITKPWAAEPLLNRLWPGTLWRALSVPEVAAPMSLRRGIMNHGQRTGVRRTVGFSRRQLLQVGGVGVLGLGLPQLLQAGAPVGRPPAGPAKSC